MATGVQYTHSSSSLAPSTNASSGSAGHQFEYSSSSLGSASRSHGHNSVASDSSRRQSAATATTKEATGLGTKFNKARRRISRDFPSLRSPSSRPSSPKASETAQRTPPRRGTGAYLISSPRRRVEPDNAAQTAALRSDSSSSHLQAEQMHMFRARHKPKEKDSSEDKPYGSLRALRSPFRPASPTKRRSRSLEVDLASVAPESPHVQSATVEETLPPAAPSRPLSTATNGTARRRSGETRQEVSASTTPESGPEQTAAIPKKKKKRLVLITRAIQSLRSFSPSGRRSPGASPIPEGRRTEELPRGRTINKLESWLPPRLFSHSRSRPSSPTTGTSTPRGPTHIGQSASEPSDVVASVDASSHLPNSASDPGPPILNTITPTPPQPTAVRERLSIAVGGLLAGGDDANGSGATGEPTSPTSDAQRRAEKLERRRSPLARIVPPRLFRRESLDGRARIPSVGSPILRTGSRAGHAEHREPLQQVPERSRSGMLESTSTVHETPAVKKAKQVRHNSFDFETPASPGGAKVRFAGETGSDPPRRLEESDSGVSGIGSEASGTRPRRSSGDKRGPSSSTVGLVRTTSSRGEGEASARRPRPRSSPPGAGSRGPTGSLGRSTRPVAGPAPIGTFTSTGLPQFEFERSVPNTTPSPARTTFGAVRTSPATALASGDGSVNASSSTPTSHAIRRGKGRSLDLNLGLAWAPQRLREDAVMSFGGGPRPTRGKWGLEARSSVILIGSEGEGEGESSGALGEFGKLRAGRDEVLRTYREVLGEQADITFRRYLRRFEAGAIPFSGPTGLMSHVDRLLDSTPAMDIRRKRRLLDDLARVIAPIQNR